MSGNNVIFDDKNINKGNFYRNKILFQTDNSDVNKIHISEKASYGKEKKNHLNTLLDIMTIMTLGHYV